MMMGSPLGKVVIDGDRAAIVFERRIPHPIDAVWAAITEPEHRAAWLGPTSIEPREGGTVELTAEGPPVPREMREITGRIRVWDPPRVFEHEWKQSLVGDTVIRYELTPDGDATTLRLTHSRLAEPDARGYISGTHAYLDRLEAHLEGSELPRWLERYGAVQPSYSQ
jgi:uncharacterized protein YndB with AHSA1/START domain